jgi:hypothetical protein
MDLGDAVSVMELETRGKKANAVHVAEVEIVLLVAVQVYIDV